MSNNQILSIIEIIEPFPKSSDMGSIPIARSILPEISSPIGCPYAPDSLILGYLVWGFAPKLRPSFVSMGINTMGVEHRPIQERLATKPEEPKKMSAATQLLNIAVRAGNLAYDTSRSAESYRLAGRLSRLVQFRLRTQPNGRLPLSPRPTSSRQKREMIFLPAIPIASIYCRAPSRKSLTRTDGKTSGMKSTLTKSEKRGMGKISL